MGEASDQHPRREDGSVTGFGATPPPGSPFGSLENVRPTTKLTPYHCPWGHDMRIGGCNGSYSHFLATQTYSCDACRLAGRRDNGWVPIDPTCQHPADAAPDAGIALVVVPPPQRAAVGQIQARINGVTIGDIDVSLCSVEERAVIEQVRVDDGFRRYGFGSLLVAAALARAPRYAWSTTTVTSPEARAFWAAVGEPTNIGDPQWCSHMRVAAGGTPL